MSSEVQMVQTARHKHFLRNFVRREVMALSPAMRERLSRDAVRRLSALPVFRDAQTVGLYAGIEGEVDTSLLFRLCQEEGKALAVPVVFPDTKRMEYSFLAAPVRWTRNVHGIAEPREKRFLDHRNVELLIVPGRAFTPEGHRLGTGGGYFDRFLERHPGGIAVGLAFDQQVVPRLPSSVHDRPMDFVVTPTRVFSRHRPHA